MHGVKSIYTQRVSANCRIVSYDCVIFLEAPRLASPAYSLCRKLMKIHVGL